MNIKNLVQGFLMMFVLVLVVSAVVSYLYSYLVHGNGLVDWEGSIRIAFILAVVFPAIQEIDRRKKQ